VVVRRAPIAAILVVLPAAAAGCSSSESALAAGDAGVDATAAPPPPAPVDAGADVVEAGIDCGTDVLGDGLTKHLACAGLYADLAAKTVAPANRAYTPGLVFWSDGADKQRWVSLPAGATIDATDPDAWRLPVGTKLWKEFAVAGKRIETRLFAKTAAGWKHTTYRWNDAETDAVRKDAGETVALPGRTPFEVPSTSQCDYCHAAQEEPVLGFDAVSLGAAGAKGVTLATLAAEGKLVPAPAATTVTIPDDETGKAAAALGWLHANCGGCHVDHLGAGAYGSALRMRLRASELATAASAKELPAYLTGYCKPSERVNPDTGAFYTFIAGGSPSTSLASILAHARAAPGKESIVTQMPPIVTHVADEAGVALLDAWIGALPACP
jgi:hypothetical protein